MKMKTQATPANNSTRNLFDTVLSVLFLFISITAFSQAKPESSNKGMTSLLTVVEGIKEKNESIKNVEHINVMVNDLLIENLVDYTIDPKSIAVVEVVVLEPKAGSPKLNPSIIINTRR
jgi:hypothetical protein